jgi:hypothetical protein
MDVGVVADGIACVKMTLYYGIAIASIVIGSIAIQSQEEPQVHL